MSKPRGRHFFANPGPTNIPDSVLRAMDRGSIDFNDPDFVGVYDDAFAGVKRVLRTSQHLFMYNASGHGAWEASLPDGANPRPDERRWGGKPPGCDLVQPVHGSSPRRRSR